MDCSHFRKKLNFQNGQKSPGNKTNMDIILAFLAEPLDKHGTPPWHITLISALGLSNDMGPDKHFTDRNLKNIGGKQEVWYEI